MQASQAIARNQVLPPHSVQFPVNALGKAADNEWFQYLISYYSQDRVTGSCIDLVQSGLDASGK